MRNHNKLKAFQLADELALLTYSITRDFPSDEKFGLVSQMRRCSVSVPSNIVEGSTRKTQADYTRFLEIAFGSLRELQYQFSLAVRLDYISAEKSIPYQLKIQEAEKVMASLLFAMRSDKQ